MFGKALLLIFIAAALLAVTGCELTPLDDPCIQAVRAFIEIELTPGFVRDTCIRDWLLGYCDPVQCIEYISMIIPPEGCPEIEFLRDDEICGACPEVDFDSFRDAALWGMCGVIDLIAREKGIIE